MSTERGKAIIFNGAGKPLEEKQFELPTNLEPMEALVEISLSTVCGSDVHTWMGHRPFPTQSILGHEMVGKIIKIGSELKKDFLGNSLAEGDRITWSMTVSCGKCFFCKTAKLPQKCYELFKYGHVQSDKPPYFTGGYAKYVLLRKGSYIFKVPSELSDEEVAPLMCAGATVISGMYAADFSSSDYVVVQGCGALGLYACAFAKELGAREVIAIDVDFQRIELAKQFGADHTIKADSNSTIEKRKHNSPQKQKYFFCIFFHYQLPNPSIISGEISQ